MADTRIRDERERDVAVVTERKCVFHGTNCSKRTPTPLPSVSLFVMYAILWVRTIPCSSKMLASLIKKFLCKSLLMALTSIRRRRKKNS